MPAKSNPPPGKPCKSAESGDKPLTLSKVLEEFPMKRSWVYAAIKDGRFPPGWHIGRNRFWWRSEVRAALEQLLVPAKPPTTPPQGTATLVVPPKTRRGAMRSHEE